MVQSVESQLSIDDARVIEIEQFGAPLGVYKPKAGYVHFVRGAGLFLFFLAAVLLSITMLGFLKHPQPGVLVLAFFLVVFGGSLFSGWLLLWVEAPRAQHEHIIACEQGLLQTGLGIRSKNIETVRWANIQSVSPGFFGLGYSIRCRGGMTLTISLYQDSKGLFSLMRERTEMR
jgi:hypothetical protein